LALALFVGMAAGTYSSICIATPLAVQLKEREPAIKEHTARVLGKREGAEERAAAAAPVSDPKMNFVKASGSAKRNQPERSTRSKRNKGSH
jgi:preprotein translocase subunit SecF